MTHTYARLLQTLHSIADKVFNVTFNQLFILKWPKCKNFAVMAKPLWTGGGMIRNHWIKTLNFTNYQETEGKLSVV
jgi:hypothetical protein